MPSAAIAVPTIVFHGDADRTVNGRNAAAIVEQASARHDPATLRSEDATGTASGGRGYRRTVYRDAANVAVAEHWTLHGAGHAWSGGSAAGSYTDARGPDASREMIRFFYALPRAGTA
jgi:poly(3-hydroxybutyrate) depolymerase